MDMNKYLGLFVEEANEHIQGALRETGRLAAGHAAPESLAALFRHFHSIKGMAASMGFAEIGSLSHAAEDLFDRIRRGARLPPGEVCDLTTEALDAMTAMVAEAATSGPGARLSFDPAPLAGRMRALLSTAPGEEDAAAAAPPPAILEAIPAARRVYRCAVTVDPRADMPGARAALVVSRLEPLGEILEMSPPRERLGEPGFDGELTVRLASDRPQAALIAAVSDLLDLKLVEVSEMPAGAQASADAAGASGAPATVRVPTLSLDRFLDAIAGLVARRGAAAEAVRSRDHDAALSALDQMSSSILRLRDEVMLMRLIPFEHITPRLTRAVRELCRTTGRRAVLHIAGADVALDRSVLEEVVDPLLHILRNAVDHGIRPPGERERAGKPATGSLRLEVVRMSDGVQVIVEDDGEGMDVEGIRAAALERGYATRAQLAAMEEDDVLMLTTIPGFSTAARVTEVSGRGVGMDIVRTRVEALHGHMAIRSRRGIGTRIELTLPLTVAILDAFLVESAGRIYAIPSSSVQRVQLVPRASIRSGLAGRFVATPVEGGRMEVTPLRMLDELLQPRGAAMPRSDQTPVLSYQTGGASGSLGVTRILGRREVVVKPLGPPLERMRRYSGAALLDDGGLALVLDLANLGAAATAV